MNTKSTTKAEWDRRMDANPRPTDCNHDNRFGGVFDLPKECNGCIACFAELKAQQLTALRDAAQEVVNEIEHPDKSRFKQRALALLILTEQLEALSDSEVKDGQ